MVMSSIDCAHAATHRTLPMLGRGLCDRLTSPSNKSFKVSERYLSPAFLTQRYGNQLAPDLLETYHSFSLSLSFQERAFEAPLTSESNALTHEEATFALRYSTLYKLLIFFAEGNNDDATNSRSKSPDITPIQTICRVVIPIVALEDQFIGYRRLSFTATFMNAIYKTLNSKIDLGRAGKHILMSWYGQTCLVYLSLAGSRGKRSFGS